MSLTSDRNTPMKALEQISAPVAGSTKIYAGSIVVANTTGYAAPGSASSGLAFLGRAEETVDNTTGADGAKSILIRREQSFKWANSNGTPVTQASLGKLCYIEDDQTVSVSSSNGTRSPAGIVVGLDSDGVWVGRPGQTVLSATATLDFASIAATASADLTITVTGAAVNDGVSLGLPAAPAAGLVFDAFVSAANTVTVRATNVTAAPVDAVSATYRATVIKQ